VKEEPLMFQGATRAYLHAVIDNFSVPVGT
jgi:hypothetical protein